MLMTTDDDDEADDAMMIMIDFNFQTPRGHQRCHGPSPARLQQSLRPCCCAAFSLHVVPARPGGPL